MIDDFGSYWPAVIKTLMIYALWVLILVMTENIY